MSQNVRKIASGKLNTPVVKKLLSYLILKKKRLSIRKRWQLIKAVQY